MAGKPSPIGSTYAVAAFRPSAAASAGIGVILYDAFWQIWPGTDKANRESVPDSNSKRRGMGDLTGLF